MRKSKIISFVIITLVMLISVGSFSYVLDNYKSQNKNTVISIQNVASQGKSKSTIGDYEALLNSYEEIQDSGFYSELSNQKVYSAKVTPVLTNSNYLRINNISYTGEGFTEAMVKQGLSTVIVGKSLANKYFYGDRAIGRTFKMSGTRYRITGIYDDKNDVLNNLFKDGKERIFINYTGYNNYKNQVVHQLSCTADSKAYNKFAGAGLKNFVRVSFEEKNMAVNDFTVIISLILIFVISVYLIKLWIYSLKSTTLFFHKKLEKNYVFKMLASNVPSLLIRSLIIIGIPVGLFFLVIFVTSDFHIVYNYIDRENLFDISFMIKKLAEVLGNERAMVYGGNPYFINLYNGTLLILAGLTPIVTTMFFFFFHSLVNLSEERNPKYIIAGIFLIISVISAITSLVGGVGYSFLQITLLITAVLVLKCVRDYLKQA